MAASDHLGQQFGTQPSKCATCGKSRKLVSYSSFGKWGGEPDQCMGCGTGRANGGTGGYGGNEVPASKPVQVTFTDDDWT